MSSVIIGSSGESFGRRWLQSCAAALALAGFAAAQGTTVRVSVTSSGDEVSDWSYDPALSAQGRFVAFCSYASDLVAGDTNSARDAFVQDRATGQITRVSVGSSGNQGNGASICARFAISSDGRRVAFASWTDNLVPGDTNGHGDIFVHDLATGQTTLVSLSTGGGQGNAESYYSALSADGGSVAFTSYASNLVPGDTNDWPDIFVHDLATGETACVSVDSSGNPGDLGGLSPTLSSDGRLVAFESFASSLVPGDTNGHEDIFVRDRRTWLTRRVSVDSNGHQATGDSRDASISADGRFVAFTSEAADLVAGDTNGVDDIFVHDLRTGHTVRVSVDSSGIQANLDSHESSISADGRWVAFVSLASDLVAGDTNGARDMFVHDLRTGRTTLASASSSGQQGNSDSWPGSISPDGGYVAFCSSATNLVSGDDNDRDDVFVRDRAGCSPTVASYCVAGTTSNGCVPSISGAGTPSASAGSGFEIAVSAVDGQANGAILYGLAGSSATPWSGGSSLVCLRPPLQRTTVQSSGGSSGACDGVFTLDWNQFVATQASALGSPFAGGETVWAQAWFHDPQAPGGSNLSDALWFQVCP